MNFIEKKIEGNIFNDTKTISNDDTTLQDSNYDVEEKEKKNTPLGNRLQDILKTEVKKSLLTADINTRGPSAAIIVIDNFYNNAMETRNYILTQEFSVKGNYPGQRTISYANDYLKDVIQKYVEIYGGKITRFECPKPDNSDAGDIYNGMFQYTTSRDRSWIHCDAWNNWAGVLFLTPDAPVSAGTSFYRFYDGSMCKKDSGILNNLEEIDTYCQDLTKWELVDTVGNVFNRLVLFNSTRYHMSMDYFGNCKENGRLFQVFFFSTER